MNESNNSYQIGKIFSRLSLLSIPLASVPLFFSLLKATTPSSQVASPSKATMPSSQVASPSASPQLSSTISTDPEPWQRQLSRQSLPTVASPTVKTQNHVAQRGISNQSPVQKHLPKAKSQHKQTAVAHRYTPPKIQIRVAIANGVDTLALGASTSAEIRDSSGKLLRKLPADQGFYAQINGSALMLGSWQLPAVIWIEPNRGGYIYVDNHWYRGRILLAAQGSTLLAVNEVALEKYLYSVVGSEMSSSSPAEALKAQAIAARSYALVHLVRPASAWYNLGNNERWQVYKGLDSEFNTTQHATDETAGMILSYQGGIVESLYAASDEIVASAHGGLGMSQQGAYKLAAQGYNYQQILGTYYPGTSLARLAPQVRK